MMISRLLLRACFEDESGQASVEYMLMLSIAMAMAISVVKKFIQPYLAKMADTFSTQMQNALFNKANMHSLRIGGAH
jgi:Flp pilus assembly pilin Flp